MPETAIEEVRELSHAEALPRVAAVFARSSSRLYSHVEPMTIALQGRALRLRWDRDGEGAAQQAFRFRLGPHGGELLLDMPALALLIGERRPELLPPELRYLLLAEALQPLAEALEKATRLRFEWAPEAVQQEPACAPVHFLIGDEQGSTFGGGVRFDDDEALDALLSLLKPPARRVDAEPSWLRVPLPFAIGRTRLSLREIAGIRRGDIVGIESWANAGNGLVVGAAIAGTGLTLVGRAEGARISFQHIEDTMMNRDQPATNAASDENDASALPLDRLDAMEVMLRFEVGDLLLSLGELKSIRPGHVFDLGQPLNRSQVRILAHGNVLGKGHLVAIGDRLGVRVSEFAPGEE
jgi:type III secretion protein Q